MKNRNPFAVFILSIITVGIYGIVWQVKTKNEMNSLGANIPTAWLLIVPFVSLYWLWKYGEGVEKVTGGKTSGVLAFLMLGFVWYIGAPILQSAFNKVGSAPAASVPNPVATAPIAPTVAAPIQPAAAPTTVETPVAAPVAAPVVTPSDPAAQGQPPQQTV